MGFVTELEVAQHLAADKGLLIVRWGDKSGTRGSDLVAVNPVTGDVLLVDSKYRGKPQTLPHSKTFDFDLATNPNGPQQLAFIKIQAREAIEAAGLSSALSDAALAKVRAGDFGTITIGAGNVKNNNVVLYCGGKRC